MTRPKVAPELRQRTAQACESCKRRKQKCDGAHPCKTCIQRRFLCDYIARDSGEHPLKKVRLNDTGFGSSSHHCNGGAPSPIFTAADGSIQPTKTPKTSMLSLVTGPLVALAKEPNIINKTCVLRDNRGRLQTMGNVTVPALLRYLRGLRELDPLNSFSIDPARHELTEHPWKIKLDTSTRPELPDFKTCSMLAESFFIGTHGILDLFDSKSYMINIETALKDRLNIDSVWRCASSLVFAIGFVLATPAQKSKHYDIIVKLRKSHPRLDERLFLLADDQDLDDESSDYQYWEVATLLLKSVYLICKSKRYDAYILFRRAQALADLMGYDERQSSLRSCGEGTSLRRLWRSLFIMESFYSMTAGSARIRSGSPEWKPSRTSMDLNGGDTQDVKVAVPETSDPLTESSIDATLKHCDIINNTIKKIYNPKSKKTQLGKVTNELYKPCQDWEKEAPPELIYDPDMTLAGGEGISILHCNLFRLHAMLLLARPFYHLYFWEMNLLRTSQEFDSQAVANSIANFSDIISNCTVGVSIAARIVKLIVHAHKDEILAHSNPWVIHFLSSALCILHCALILPITESNHSIDHCIKEGNRILTFCGYRDVLAYRMQNINEKLYAAITQYKVKQAASAINFTFTSLPTHRSSEQLPVFCAGPSMGMGMEHSSGLHPFTYEGDAHRTLQQMQQQSLPLSPNTPFPTNPYMYSTNPDILSPLPTLGGNDPSSLVSYYNNEPAADWPVFPDYSEDLHTDSFGNAFFPSAMFESNNNNINALE